MLDSRFSPHVTQNGDSGRATGFCGKNPAQQCQKVQILLKYQLLSHNENEVLYQESINFTRKLSCQKAAPE